MGLWVIRGLVVMGSIEESYRYCLYVGIVVRRVLGVDYKCSFC